MYEMGFTKKIWPSGIRIFSYLISSIFSDIIQQIPFKYVGVWGGYESVPGFKLRA